MPRKTSNAPRMDDVPIENILSPEGVDDLIEEFVKLRDNAKAHDIFVSAAKAIKSVAPQSEDPKRYVVTLPDGTGVGVIEVTLASRKESIVKAGVTVTRKIILNDSE